MDDTMLKHDDDDDDGPSKVTARTTRTAWKDASTEDDNFNNNSKKFASSEATGTSNDDNEDDDDGINIVIKHHHQQQKKKTEEYVSVLEKPTKKNNNGAEEVEQDDNVEVVEEIPLSFGQNDSSAEAAAAAVTVLPPNNNHHHRRHHRRRKRNNPELHSLHTNTTTTITISEQIIREQHLLEFEHQKHSLRISASNVAALSGFHPYKVLPELLLDLVYQGIWGRMLLQQDACQLQLQLLSQDQMLQQLASKAGAETTAALQEALQIKAGIKIVSTIQDADKIKQRVVQEAQKSIINHKNKDNKASLSRAELRVLQEGVRSAVDTGYGTVHEDDALDLYEQECGWPVQERNAEIRVWPFRKSEDDDDEEEEERSKFLSKTAVPLADAQVLWQQQQEHQQEDGTIAMATSNDELDGVKKSSTEGSKRIKIEHPTEKGGQEANNDEQQQRPYFLILGSVDGIREELVPVSNKEAEDDDSWIMRKVIVECKHRMKQIRQVPPLYEQIQTCVYCQMYGVSEADIVQVLRRSNKEQPKICHKKPTDKVVVSDSATLDKWVVRSDNRSRAENISDQDSKVPTSDDKQISKPKPLIYFTRVSLEDSVTQHRSNWQQIVLPRLRSFVDAVYDIRSNPSKRYRLLASNAASTGGMDDAWKLLHEHCPWLMECETAYHRALD